MRVAAGITGLKPSVNETRVLLNCIERGRESLADSQKVQRFLDFAFGFARNDRKAKMKLVIAATGASGAIYLQRLLEQIDCAANEVHLVMSSHAREVAKHELDAFKIPAEVSHHPESDMNVPFVSGSARFDAMVIVPCSMATLGRIASGSSDSVLLRAADVFLKERRKLFWSLGRRRGI